MTQPSIARCAYLLTSLGFLLLLADAYPAPSAKGVGAGGVTRELGSRRRAVGSNGPYALQRRSLE